IQVDNPLTAHRQQPLLQRLELGGLADLLTVLVVLRLVHRLRPHLPNSVLGSSQRDRPKVNQLENPSRGIVKIPHALLSRRSRLHMPRYFGPGDRRCANTFPCPPASSKASDSTARRSGSSVPVTRSS